VRNHAVGRALRNKACPSCLHCGDQSRRSKSAARKSAVQRRTALTWRDSKTAGARREKFIRAKLSSRATRLARPVCRDYFHSFCLHSTMLRSFYQPIFDTLTDATIGRHSQTLAPHARNPNKAHPTSKIFTQSRHRMRRSGFGSWGS